ncbi:P-loop containing nucleoside triphosphate hydrolase [Parasponia andersonii]|uniref:P-loop containing nucleoside triphosphate hydrolase n=1 Tax=Parasponia andersonii TaxID=3476 RepID=A0A2P5CEH7_PARAD|nr:P-loop containing nucleoside triphosphate hydrolase [Parasponia andersonii]
MIPSELEKVVQKAVDNVAIGRTTIIVAHRLSTIKNADIIVVVENGQIKEIGMQSELIQEENSMYNSLVCLQREEKNKRREEFNYTSYFGTSSNNNFSNFGVSKLAPPNLVSQNGNKKTLCLSAIIFSATQPLHAAAMGTTISVYFSTDQDKIKDKIRNLALGPSFFFFFFFACLCFHY